MFSQQVDAFPGYPADFRQSTLVNVMKKLYRITLKIALTIILPLFFAMVILGLSFRIILQANYIRVKSEEVREYQKILSDRKVAELELKRAKIIMNMEDHMAAVEKANGKPLEEDEERIIMD